MFKVVPFLIYVFIFLCCQLLVNKGTGEYGNKLSCFGALYARRVTKQNEIIIIMMIENLATMNKFLGNGEYGKQRESYIYIYIN